MELIKQIISQSLIREEKIASISEPGYFHSVKLFIDGGIKCCDGNCHCKFKKEDCRHIKTAKETWTETHGWRWLIP